MRADPALSHGQRLRHPGTGSGWADHDGEYITHGFKVDGQRARALPQQLHERQRELRFHPGGSNHLFADGSVRFIKDTLTIRLYVKLISMTNGEILSADAL